jgi:hypothetical protein
MTFFSYFYCKAYNYYNTTGKKSDDTLRGSAIILLSLFQLFNILTVVFFLSFIIKKTIGEAWEGLLIVGLLLAYNFYRISKDRSIDLRSEVAVLPPEKNKKMLIALRLYIFLSSVFFLGVIAMTVYIKKKYGNYDLH